MARYLRLRRSLLGLVFFCAFGGIPARAAEPIRILAAGSLGAVLPKLIAASGIPADAIASPVFGPADVLRDRLLAGESADLFTSADVAGPIAVADKRGQALVAPFARNRMCLLTQDRLGVTASTVLDRIMAPEFRLAVSTHGADPGGDYARAVFKRVDAVRPGAEAILAAKAEIALARKIAAAPGCMASQQSNKLWA